MTDTLTIREYRDTDLGEVLEVLRAALGENPLLRRTPELFSWKHVRNPFGRSIILLAEESGRIAGIRAFMRWELETPAGDTLRCVRAVDTATHPDFHRRGIFRRLTLEALDAAAADGVDLVFNTPNPKSGAGYLKMGWSEVGPIGIMIRPAMGIIRGSGDAEVLPDPKDFVDRPLPAGGIEIVDRPANGLRTPRTSDYLSWRFEQHPTANYLTATAAGSVALLRPNHRGNRRELVLSDLLGPEPRRAARLAASASRADYMAGWFSSGSPERTAAMRAGLVPVPKVTALSLVCRPLTDLPIDPTDLASWDFALSDLELL